jgi:hypothetical protein
LFGHSGHGGERGDHDVGHVETSERREQ